MNRKIGPDPRIYKLSCGSDEAWAARGGLVGNPENQRVQRLAIVQELQRHISAQRASGAMTEMHSTYLFEGLCELEGIIGHKIIPVDLEPSAPLQHPPSGASPVLCRENASRREAETQSETRLLRTSEYFLEVCCALGLIGAIAQVILTLSYAH